MLHGACEKVNHFIGICRGIQWLVRLMAANPRARVVNNLLQEEDKHVDIIRSMSMGLALPGPATLLVRQSDVNYYDYYEDHYNALKCDKRNW